VGLGVPSHRVDALKTNRKDQNAKYEAEIKRLRDPSARMDDEIRQEAMRPFLSGDQTLSVWPLKAKGRVKESAGS
jgi:hypothetical protein